MAQMTLPITLRRLPFVSGAMLILLIALWAGLLRLGWEWPGMPVMAMVYHGPLMVGGFVGTLISLERAVALGRVWTYGAPLASAAGGICLLAGAPPLVGQWLLLIASILLVVIFVQVTVRQPTLFLVVMGIGALAWVLGNAVWIHRHLIPPAVPSWIAFLVLTIVGERLELSRFLPRTPMRQPTFVAAAALYLTGIIVGLWLTGAGMAITGLGMIALALWLAVFDLARRTIRQRGLTRFTAACLLSGYFWLAAGGALSIWHSMIVPMLNDVAASSWLMAAPSAGMAYDSILHAVLLGFVFAMIFGHAPIIFPAVLAVRMDYRPRFYLHLGLLQLSVLLRVICDLAGWWTTRQWAGLLNAVAIILFLANTVTSLRLHQDRSPSSAGGARTPEVPKPVTISLGSSSIRT